MHYFLLIFAYYSVGCIQSKDATKNTKQNQQSNPVYGSPSLDAGRPTTTPLTQTEIESRIESSDNIREHQFGTIKMKYAWVSQRGYYPDGVFKVRFPCCC